MLLVTKPISKTQLEQMAENFSDELVKAVVDVKKGIMVVDAPMHAD